MVIQLTNGYNLRCTNCGVTLAAYNNTPIPNLQALWLRADQAGYVITKTGVKCSYCV